MQNRKSQDSAALRSRTAPGALAMLVDARGRPVEVRVQQSRGFPRLLQAAVEGLRQWRFKAAMRAGTATTAWISVRVRFRLDA